MRLVRTVKKKKSVAKTALERKWVTEWDNQGGLHVGGELFVARWGAGHSKQRK